jgi:hypothetical protein
MLLADMEAKPKVSLPGSTRQSIHLGQEEKMDARGVSAFTRVFDALLPSHVPLPHLHRIDIW